MSKQIGITSLELLLSLSIISSVTAYTLTLSEEVETAMSSYQQVTDIKKIKAKIQSANQ